MTTELQKLSDPAEKKIGDWKLYQPWKVGMWVVSAEDSCDGIYGEVYRDRQMAIDHGFEIVEGDDFWEPNTFHIAQLQPLQFCLDDAAECILRGLSLRATAGEDNSLFDGVEQEKLNELTESVRSALAAWLEKHGIGDTSPGPYEWEKVQLVDGKWTVVEA